MPAAFVQVVGTAAHKVSASSFACPVSASTTAGNLIVLGVTFDNLSATTPTVTGLSKPTLENGTWTRIEFADSHTASGGAGIRTELWAIKTTGWIGGVDSITITLSGAVVAKTAIMLEASGAEVTLRAAASKAVGSGVAISASTTANAGDFVVGLSRAESANVITGIDTDTVGGAWSPGVTVVTSGGSATTNVSSLFQRKVPDTTGTQTYDATERAGGIIIAAFRQVASGPDAPSSFAAFGIPL